MPEASTNALLRALPSVDEVLRAPELLCLAECLPHPLLTRMARDEIGAAREAALGSGIAADREAVTARVTARARALCAPSLRPVVNATGIIIHTNLGRSPLAPQALAAVNEAARSYSTLEYDIGAMARGSRHDHCEELICALTGAQAAIAVNNNAAAVMMVLAEFAAGHEAVVSRGELIEIGGSFRIPDIMEQSRARMVEVGTTNKTHLSDYERAISDDTALLLKVHTSNYRIVGFTEAVSGRQLRSLADKVNATRPDGPALLVYEDLGSGAILPTEAFRAEGELTAREALEAGCDVVSFSGDKLLGGPQAGIIIGSAELIGRLKRHPLARALRLDKMTLAALEATLALYLTPEKALRDIPVLRMIEEDESCVRKRAERLCARIREEAGDEAFACTVAPTVAHAGGGSLPTREIPSFGVRISPAAGDAAALDRHLVQKAPVPVIGRVHKGELILDARTLVHDDEIDVIAAEVAAFAGDGVAR